jgi:Uncharacterized conserved protein
MVNLMNKKYISAMIILLSFLLASCSIQDSSPSKTADTSNPSSVMVSEATSDEKKDNSEPDSDKKDSDITSNPNSEEKEEDKETETVAINKDSQIYVRRDTDGTDNGFNTLIEMMNQNDEPFYQTSDTPNGIVARNDIILLFYNGQWNGRGGTNTDLINSVVEAIAAHPDGFDGEIIIADSGQGDGDLDHAQANSANRDQSVLDVVNKQKHLGVRVSGYLWDDIMDIEVSEFDEGDDKDGYVVEPGISESTKLVISYPKFTTEYGTKISVKNGVWNGENYDSDIVKLINMPILKSHWLYRATACVKNYMGMPSQNLSSKAGGDPHNSVALGSMGEMMARSRMPSLNILDMIYIGARGGPWLTYDEASDYFAIAASTDPFALDYWAVKNVLMPEAKKVGNSNAEAMNPDSNVPGSFGHWMSLALGEIQKAGYENFVFGDDSVAVHEK